MKTREKEPAYQQPDPYDDLAHQHSEQGEIYEDVNDPSAIVNQNFDYEDPPGDDATTGRHQQTAKYVNARPSGPRPGGVTSYSKA